LVVAVALNVHGPLDDECFIGARDGRAGPGRALPSPEHLVLDDGQGARAARRVGPRGKPRRVRRNYLALIAQRQRAKSPVPVADSQLALGKGNATPKSARVTSRVPNIDATSLHIE